MTFVVKWVWLLALCIKVNNLYIPANFNSLISFKPSYCLLVSLVYPEYLVEVNSAVSFAVSRCHGSVRQ